MRIKQLTVACALALGISSAANANISVNNWTLDVTGVDGINVANQGGNPPAGSGTKAIGIDHLTFESVFRSITNDAGILDGLPTAGETFDVFAYGTIDAFKDATNSTISPTLFNTVSGFGFSGWELTFQFEVSGLYTDVDGDDANFTHTAAGAGGTTGLLEFYVDYFGNGGVQGTSSNAASYTDGIKIATFAIEAGDGGVYDFATGNGSDRATFRLTDALAGVWEDQDGNDLKDLVDQNNDPILLGFTASDFDSDPNETGTPFQHTVGAFNCQMGNPLDFCGSENGDFNLAVVPEPASLALMGLGLFGLVGANAASRRKKQS